MLPFLCIFESMSVYVKDADYKRHDSLEEIAYAALKPVWKYINNLPQDQQDYYLKNRLPDLLTPDGLSHRDPTGTLNLYTSGLVSDALKGVLSIVLDELKKLGMVCGPIRKEQSGVYDSEVIRIPILKNPHADTYAGPPDLNMSNVNAYQIFKNVLQYEGEDSFTMNAHELIERIDTILKHDPKWMAQNQIRPTDSAWPEAERDDQDVDNPHLDFITKTFGGGGKKGGPRMIGGGLSPDLIEYRLLQIKQIAQWAIAHGYEEMYVC